MILVSSYFYHFFDLFWGDLKGLGSLGWPFSWQFIYESWIDSSRLKKWVQYCTLCLGYPWAVAQNYWHSIDGWFQTKYHQCGKPNATNHPQAITNFLDGIVCIIPKFACCLYIYICNYIYISLALPTSLDKSPHRMPWYAMYVKKHM